MIHQYQLGGYNIVLDVCSGAVHVVDEVAYDIIARFEAQPREEVIAEGDGANDIEMLQYAGIGIAMGSVAEEKKRHAGSVTASNDDEGVLQVIRKYF